MKKIISSLSLIAVLAGMAPGFALAQTATTSPTDVLANLLNKIQELRQQMAALQQEKQKIVSEIITILKAGSRGDEVKALQVLLAADPAIYPEGLITGFFGPATAKAVKRFQAKNKLSAVGIVGPQTRAKLNELLKNTPIAFESATSTTGASTSTTGKPCAIVPPGHLIAPGWLRKMGGVMPIVPTCQTLPAGIAAKLGITSASTSTPDTVAPIISSIAASATTTSATINWTTNEAATSKVYYSTASPLDTASASTLSLSVSGLTMNHAVNLTSLNTSTTYYFAVESADALNNVATSTQQSFTTGM